MSKKALHFGAGNIGRGFICPELQNNDFEVIFADVNQELVDQINSKNNYFWLFSHSLVKSQSDLFLYV